MEQQRSQIFQQSLSPEQQRLLEEQQRQEMRRMAETLQKYHLYITKDGQIIKIPKNPNENEVHKI